MFDDPLSLLSLGIWLLAAGMYPVGFLFGACSTCCEVDCGFGLFYERCMRITRVGNPTPGNRGTHVPISLRGNPGSGVSQSMSSNWQATPIGSLVVLNAPTQVILPLRLSLSSSGNSRVPVGQSRFQVWRFNVSEPPIIEMVRSVADTAGPPWYLQVDINVLGIKTASDVISEYSQYGSTFSEIITALADNPTESAEFESAFSAAEEPGVDETLGVDEHGQNKLILNVKQGGATIVHTTAFQLTLVGFQRWPTLSNSVLTELTRTATLAGGDSVPGWTFQKLSGITVLQRALLARVGARYLLDEASALAFLNGDQAATGPWSQGGGSEFQAAYEMLPDSLLCGRSIDDVGTGIALGIFPTLVARTNGPTIVGEDTILASCGDKYLLVANDRALTDPSAVPSVGWGNGQVAPSSFWDGESLLWAVENPPYRDSFTVIRQQTFMGFVLYEFPSTFSLDLEGGGFFGRQAPPLVKGSVTITCDVRVAVFHFIPGLNTDQTVRLTSEPIILPAFESDPPSYQDMVEQFDGAEFFGHPAGPAVTTVSPTLFPEGHSVRFYLFRVGTNLIRDTPFEGNNSQYISCLGGQPNIFIRPLSDQSTLFPGAGFVTDYQIFTSYTNCVANVTQPPFIPPQDRMAGEPTGAWSPVGAEGGVSTALRPNFFPEGTFSTLTATIPPNGSRLPVYRLPVSGGGTGQGFIQPGGACSLLGLISLDGSSTNLIPAISLISLTRGECRHYAVHFTGSIIASGSTAISCDGCEPQLTVVAGGDYATARIVPDGNRKGAIEVIATRTWLGGQGITFTVTCGDDTITQVIRRADTVPTPPQNLTVVRGPCSEAFLEWDASTWDGGQPITAYSVQFRRIGVTSWTTFGTVSPPALSATVTGLVRVGYEFRVRAVNSIGTSDQSNIAVDGFAIGAPMNLTFTRDPCDQVQLSWTAPTQSECVAVANYRLEYRVGTSGTYLVFGDVVGTATTGTITGLNPSLAYQFRVASIDEAGSEALSDAVTSGTTPAPPAGVSAFRGENSGEVDLTWDAVEQSCFPNTNYNVQFRPSATSAWTDFTRPASANKFAKVSGLTPDVTYFFRVRAVNSLGAGSYSPQSNSVTILVFE